MARAVIMPKAGITVESCIIGEWKKKIGDPVKVGDILFDYETDKAAFECESTEEGELLEIFYGNGEEIPVLVNVCAIGTKGEDVSALRPGSTAGNAPAKAESTAPAAPESPAAPEKAEAPAAVTAVAPANGTMGISPRAKELARRAGVDPTKAVPSGPHGRVVEKDVRALMKQAAKEEAAPAAVKVPETAYEDVKFSGIRRAIAKSMNESLSGAAQLTNSHSFDATSIQRCRKEFKEAGGALGGVTLGDMVLFAVSRVLKNHPDLNANVLNENGTLVLRKYHHVHLGVAVDTPRGLMVPTIFNADTKSLVEISAEVKELAAAARGGSISPDLLRGGSFTVSNLGSFGVESFTPVINPPQTGILGVCTIVNRVREKNGGMEIYPAMGLSLTYDHRAVDGAPAARFAKELCEALEKFTALLLKDSL